MSTVYKKLMKRRDFVRHYLFTTRWHHWLDGLHKQWLRLNVR